MAGFLLAASLWAADPEADWRALQGAITTPSGNLRNGRAAAQAWAARQEEINRRALAFHVEHPADPRRWEAVIVMLTYLRPFIVRVEEDIAVRGFDALVVDEVAAREWRRQLHGLVDQLLAADGATPQQKERAEVACFGLQFSESSRALIRGGKADLLELRAALDRLRGRYPDNVRVKEMDAAFWNLVCIADPFQVVTWLKLAGERGDPKLKARADRRLELVHNAAVPMALRFTAVDGREVDLAALRGKVVLIDFWATWCRPCVAELPNIRRVYAEYRDKGFEVIGIALEDAKLGANDMPGQATAKLEAAKEALGDFLLRNQVTWPQYLDGKWWKNDYAVQFSIESIPAMLLVDQNGKIVTTSARGPKLEAEVKRLLGL